MSDRYSTVVGYVPHICGVLYIRVIYDLKRSDMQMKNRFIFCGQKSARRLLLRRNLLAGKRIVSARVAVALVNGLIGVPVRVPAGHALDRRANRARRTRPTRQEVGRAPQAALMELKGDADVLKITRRTTRRSWPPRLHQDNPIFHVSRRALRESSRPRHHALEGTFFAPSPVHSFELANLQDDSKVAHACLCVSVV